MKPPTLEPMMAAWIVFTSIGYVASFGFGNLAFSEIKPKPSSRATVIFNVIIGFAVPVIVFALCAVYHHIRWVDYARSVVR